MRAERLFGFVDRSSVELSLVAASSIAAGAWIGFAPAAQAGLALFAGLLVASLRPRP